MIAFFQSPDHTNKPCVPGAASSGTCTTYPLLFYLFRSYSQAVAMAPTSFLSCVVFNPFSCCPDLLNEIPEFTLDLFCYLGLSDNHCMATRARCYQQPSVLGYCGTVPWQVRLLLLPCCGQPQLLVCLPLQSIPGPAVHSRVHQLFPNCIYNGKKITSHITC